MDAPAALDPQTKIDTTKPLEGVVTTLPRRLSDQYQERMGKLIELVADQKQRLCGWLEARIQEWEQDTSELHQTLLDDNDLCEGIVMETEYPWPGASNVHVPMTEMYMEVYKSVEKRSILGADLLWYAETDDDNLKDFLPDVEEALNYNARHRWNIEKCLSNVFWTTNRDGLGIIECTWAEEYEPIQDVVFVTSLEDFLEEFPDPESAGLTPEQYEEYALEAAQASEEFPLEIPVRYERLIYYGCKAEVVELVNFVTFPATVCHIKDRLCRGYGKRFWDRAGSVRQKVKDGVYYQEEATKLIAKAENAAGITQYEEAKDQIEGLSRTNTRGQFPLFSLVIKGRLDGEKGEEEKFLVTWSQEHKLLLECRYFPYRIDHYALFTINERPNRMIGRSIPRKTRDMNDEIDTQHNQRINGRTVATVPSFKAQNSVKGKFDPHAQENRWRPGVIFWLDDFAAFDQFKVQATDLGESMAEENNDFKIMDLYLGSAVSLLSGSAAPSDPNAPGNKTAMMIQQSNLRMDDPLSELRAGVSDLGDICLSHYYQFGQPFLTWQSEAGAGEDGRSIMETRQLHKRFLRQGISMHMSGVTVTQNPEAEMAKRLQIHQVLLQEPMYAQNGMLRVEGLRDALRAGRVPGRNRLLPPAEEIQAQEIELRKQAMLKMKVEEMAAAKERAVESNKARMSAAKEDLDRRTLAEKIAERNLGAAAGVAGDASQNGVGA
jgi:hypothetical protein